MTASKPDCKMLWNLKFLSKKNQPEKKQVDAEQDAGILFYLDPGFFHLQAPVNIVEYNQ